jgi:hypothetical protein
MPENPKNLNLIPSRVRPTGGRLPGGGTLPLVAANHNLKTSFAKGGWQKSCQVERWHEKCCTN